MEIQDVSCWDNNHLLSYTFHQKTQVLQNKQENPKLLSPRTLGRKYNNIKEKWLWSVWCHNMPDIVSMAWIGLKHSCKARPVRLILQHISNTEVSKSGAQRNILREIKSIRRRLNIIHVFTFHLYDHYVRDMSSRLTFDVVFIALTKKWDNFKIVELTSWWIDIQSLLPHHRECLQPVLRLAP